MSFFSSRLVSYFYQILTFRLVSLDEVFFETRSLARDYFETNKNHSLVIFVLFYVLLFFLKSIYCISLCENVTKISTTLKSKFLHSIYF